MTKTNKQLVTDRRKFLKAFSALTAAGYFAVKMPWIQSAMAAGTGKTVRLGLIGVGSRGEYLLGILQGIPGIEFTAFCDNYQPRFEFAQNTLGKASKGYYDHREMLEKEDLDAVVIATPLYEHSRITVDALNAGVHVFCEKAMAKTYEECNAMVEAQLKNDKILHIGHQRLYSAVYLQALKDIEAGALGKVTQIRAYWHRNNDWRRPVPVLDNNLERKINWRLYKEYSLGLMTELASHQIQVANWILDEYPEYVWGSGSINYWNDGREVYDNVNLIYKYPCGTHLVYDSMVSNKKYGFEEQVMGPKGTMELEVGKLYKEFPEPAPGMLQLINHLEHKLFDAVPIGGASWVPETASEDRGEYIYDKVMESDGSIMQMEAFISNVRENKVDHWLTRQGFYASIATIMGHRSMTTNEVEYWPKNLIV